VVHAGVSVRAAGKLTQVAGRAGEVRPQNGVLAAIGADPDRVGGAEYARDRPAQCDGKVHRPGIVGDADGRAADQRGKLAQTGLAGKIARTRGELSDLRADGTLAP